MDTWFSSGLWTFSTLGWPNQTEDLANFHPTSVLETGYDILFFWVARMILMTTYLLGDIPFKQVFLHGLVRDANKQKMSKSKGNVIDPLEYIQKYGADALRIALVFSTAAGSDIPLSEDKVRGMRNFTNKLWNIGRFIIDFAPADVKHLDTSTIPMFSKIHPEDQKIIASLNNIIAKITSALDNYRFHDGAQILYDFIWHEFADVYIESTKNRRPEAQPVLEYVFRTCLELLHPFMPFITEEIWQKLPHKGESIMITKWPVTSN